MRFDKHYITRYHQNGLAITIWPNNIKIVLKYMININIDFDNIEIYLIRL